MIKILLLLCITIIKTYLTSGDFTGKNLTCVLYLNDIPPGMILNSSLPYYYVNNNELYVNYTKTLPPCENEIIDESKLIIFNVNKY